MKPCLDFGLFWGRLELFEKPNRDFIEPKFWLDLRLSLVRPIHNGNLMTCFTRVQSDISFSSDHADSVRKTEGSRVSHMIDLVPVKCSASTERLYHSTKTKIGRFAVNELSPSRTFNLQKPLALIMGHIHQA